MKEKNQNIDPACQKINVSWLDRLSMEIQAIAENGLCILFGSCILFFFLMFLWIAECWMFFTYFPIKIDNKSMKLMVVSTLCLLAFAGQLAIFEKCLCTIVRNLPVIDWEEEMSRKYGRSLDKDKPTLDLNVVIKRFAWQKILKKAPKDVRDYLVMQENRFYCDVDTTVLTFDHKVTKFSPKVEDKTGHKTFIMETEKSGAQWVKLFSSYYDNKAERIQSHTFKGSRDTTSWVKVALEQYYKVDRQVFLKLNLPETEHCLEGKKDNTLFLFSDKDMVFKEIRTWNVESQVEVEPSSRAHAQLLARRERSTYDFEIRTTLSNPKGFVCVDFSFKYNGFSMRINVENLHEAFQLVEDGGVLTPEEKACVEVVVEKMLDEDGVEHSTSYPQIITRGTCVCLSWTDQKVDITTSPLSMDESTSDVANVTLSHSEENASDRAFVFVDQLLTTRAII
ncbi:uncharacterized protein LOC131952937 [Physella acuta]|uniref:uncharacterized protein LOC131952937 n=1 Tax=Physella acuta TaxID=109671 RepID=UPI0027DDBD46|nr:uncharacterized protein LOC131952937 [Physella acuta]